MMQDSTISAALAWYKSWRTPKKLPKTLPLLDALRREKPLTNAFAKVDALFIQHHLGPLVPRIGAMAEDGLDLKRCWFVDVPYSTNRLVRDGLRALGCPKDNMSPEFADPLKPYSRSQLARTTRLVKRILRVREDGNRDLPVVDDGAFFVRALRGLDRGPGGSRLRRLRERIRVVEQTTRGYRHLQEPALMQTIQSFGIPVVCISESYTKNLLESPFIGASVARGVSLGLSSHKRLDWNRVLVIGFGKVGRQVVPALRDRNPDAKIDVFDTNPELSASIEKQGAHPARSLPEVGSYGLVVGCTGYASFPLEARSILADDAVLVSGSSGAVELNREKFVELADKKLGDEIRILDRAATKRRGIHSPIRFQDQERQFTFLNAGFPVNFDGLLECVPTPLIQPTHALMFAACRQVLGMKGPGLAYLNFDDDFMIYRRGRQMLPAEME